ncbi:MUC1-extracellular alpha-1,4-glucan glucosidase [Fusarium heterosporum]|uniref:MUC1-extracellular alpha-1,4-glucan glucosidase n=1 Tax=Fusarium heterosporum TaxID=42747 RepID=A0A8H5X436_FUSHE|nr:MUC1-extracellular alpha-1,4-glucan glucosidase [Fusarium heterosporum]
MRPLRIHLITALSAFLLLSCLSVSVNCLVRQQLFGGHQLVRRNDFIEARRPSGEATVHGYGPPPPYYTVGPVIPTDLTSYSTLAEPTATETQTETSETGMKSESVVSSQNGTIISPSSSLSLSSGVETDPVPISADSSAKAGSTTSYETPSTVSTSSYLTETAHDGATEFSSSQTPTIRGNSSSSASTRPFTGTDISSDLSSLNGTASSMTETDLTSSSVVSTTLSDLFTDTETVPEVFTSTSTPSSLQASGMVSATGQVSSGVETASIPSDVASSSSVSSSVAVESTTTTTKILNFTVTLSVAESTDSVVTFSSTVYPVSLDQTVVTTVIPVQNSSWLSTIATISEVYPTSSDLTSGVISTVTTQGVSTESSVSRASVSFRNRTVSVTSTTYLTSILSEFTTDLTSSPVIFSSTDVASEDSTAAATKDSTVTVVSQSTVLASIIATSEKSTAPAFTSFATNSSASSASRLTLSGGTLKSASGNATTSAQTSSETLFASSALPVNATSQINSSSFTVTTDSEGSAITVRPGHVPPPGSETNSSVSTEHSVSTPSQLNFSATRSDVSFSSLTNSFFDWSTSTLIESRTSLELPSITFSLPEFSIVTTPMTPPSVTTTSTYNISIIRSTWTSTITTSLAPTSMASSGNMTAAHTSSGYNFSQTIISGMSTSNSQSTSIASPPGVSTSIITKHSSNFPFPTNTTVNWWTTASSVSRSESESANAVSSQDSETTLSAIAPGFNNTAPYGNSTSTAITTAYTSSLGEVTSSPATITTYRSWNTTSTAQWLTNSTAQVTITSTETESVTDIETRTLSQVTPITPGPPSSFDVTLTTISGTIVTKTYTNYSLTIFTPSVSVSFKTSTLSHSLISSPPFPLPSNTTAVGTGAPLWPSGTGDHPTIASSLGEISTSGATLTPTSKSTYHTVNTTSYGSATGSSASDWGTNTPFFPVTNSTTAPATFSTIVSWQPDPEPWTSWSTWSLRRGSDSSASVNFIHPHNNVVPHYYAGGAKNFPFHYQQLKLRCLEVDFIQQYYNIVPHHYLGKTKRIARQDWKLKRWCFRVDFLGRQYFGINILHQYYHVVSYHYSGKSEHLSSIRSWNQQLNHLGMGEYQFGTYWFLGNGSPFVHNHSNIPIHIEDSGMTPFPASNSTLSQISSQPSSLVGTFTGTVSPRESTTTTSSTCTDSLYYPPYNPSSLTASTSTSSLSAADGTTPGMPYSLTSVVPGYPSSTCNTTSSVSSHGVAYWSRMTHRSNMTNTFGVKDTSTYQSLTTLKTVTTVRQGGSGSLVDNYPTPTDRVTPSGISPDDPNFPWGSDSPVHRHQNSSELGIGTSDVGGGFKARANWRVWEKVKDKLKSLWHGQVSENE